MATSRSWEQAFRAWVGADPQRASRFRNYVAQSYDAEPLPIAAGPTTASG